jgi:hypothetical protein
VNPADPELGPRALQILRASGLVSARGYVAVVDAVRDEAFWARWGRRALLAFGAGQLIAGVVFSSPTIGTTFPTSPSSRWWKQR